MYLLNFKFHYTIDVVILLLYYASFLLTVCVDINLILFCLYNYACPALACIGYYRFLFDIRSRLDLSLT